MFRLIISLTMALLLSFCVHSQVDTLAIDSVPEPEVQFKPKPMVMLGLGTFTFYGDTGNGLRSNGPLTSSAALNLGVNVPLRRNIDLSFSAVFSTLTLNEPGLDFRNNFRSNISGGSAIVTYNFNDILPKDAYVQPYIGTGISTFEFLSKAYRKTHQTPMSRNKNSQSIFSCSV